MKNFQKLGLGLMVGVMAIGFSAFTNANNFATEQWHFKDGRPLTDARTASAYEIASSPTCNSNPGKPCIVQFNNSNPSTPNLAAYLSTFTSNAAVASAAVAQRDN